MTGRPPKKRIITLTLNPESETRKEPITDPIAPSIPKEEQTKVEEEDDVDIPMDASKWTPSQVEAYFKKHGLKEEGLLFREQV